MSGIPESDGFKWWLKATGLAALALGVVLGLADLRGWLRSSSRAAFLQWAENSRSGLPVSEASAQAFMRRFPVPQSVASGQVTHVTKYVQRLENGPALEMAFNYILADESRTPYVATHEQVRAWAEESPYPWLAWVLTLIGFLEVVLGTGIEWYRDRRTRGAA